MSGGFDVGSILAHLQLDGSQFRAAIASNAKDLAPLKANIESVGKSIAHWGIMAAGAAAAIGAAFGAIIVKTANAGDEINDMSKRTGIATEQLSGYKLAAEKAGSSLGGLAIGLQGLANSMQAGAVAGTAQAKMFDALGISIVDGKGKLLPLNDVLLNTADRFSRMEDGAEKATLAQDIFGRSGRELIPLLNQGADGLREEAEMAKKLGLVFSKEAAAGADAFNDAMADLKGALTGIRNDIGNALIPVARQFIEGMSSGLVVLRGEIAKFTASGQLSEWAAAMARGFISAFKLMAKAVEGLILILPSLKAAVFSVAEGFYKTLGKIAEGISKVPFVSAQASLGLAVFSSDLKAFAETYGKAADENIEKASDVVAGFDALFKALDAVAAGFGKVSTASKKAAEDVKNGWDNALQGFGAFTTQFLNKKNLLIEPIPMNLIASALPPGRALSQLIVGVKDTAEKVESIWQGFTEDIKFRWGNTIADILDGTKSLTDGMIDMFKIIKRAFFEIVANAIAKALAGIVADILGLAGIIKVGAAAGIGSAAAGAGAAAGIGGALGETMITGVSSAGAGAGTAIIGTWALPVTFAAVWLGTLFGRLFGTSAADKWETEFNKKMKQKYGSNWESFMRHDVTKSALKDTTPSPGLVVEHGPARNISGGGTAQPKGDMIINFHVSTLDADSFDRVVRTKIMPKIRDAAYRREFLIPISAVGGA